jgi:hypothetical protein
MAQSHVVSALVNKRAEIAGMIARTEQQLGQFRADLVHRVPLLKGTQSDMTPAASLPVYHPSCLTGCSGLRRLENATGDL